MTYQLVDARKGVAGSFFLSGHRSQGSQPARGRGGVAKRTGLTLFGLAFVLGACSSSAGSAETADESSGPGDGDSSENSGDGDESHLGTGGNTGSGGNVLGGDGDILAGDGDAAGGSAGDGDAGGAGSDGLGTGGGAEIPPIGGVGGAPGTGGSEALGSGGSVSGSGGAAAVDACTPQAAGTFVVEGETVLDEKTCLTWMRDNTSGDPYAEAVQYCESLVLGGYDDWRIPTAGEVATIFKCDGMWPPIDDTVFNVTGDGIWTSTESGTVAGDLPKVCGAGQSSGSYYDFGQVGGQNTRCVRGASTVPDRPECKTDTVICQ
jgi:hypothetical protein